MKALILVIHLILVSSAFSQHRAITQMEAHRSFPSVLSPHDFYPRKGFSLQSDIPLYETKQTAFYAGGSIDTYLSYFDLTVGGDLENKDVLFRIDYGMNILYFINESNKKLCVSLGVSAIIGIHAEDWSTSLYEWYFKAPSFVAGLKYHFDRYSITVGWKQNYAVFEKLKDGKEVSQDHLKQGSLFLKLCVY